MRCPLASKDFVFSDGNEGVAPFGGLNPREGRHHPLTQVATRLPPLLGAKKREIKRPESLSRAANLAVVESVEVRIGTPTGLLLRRILNHQRRLDDLRLIFPRGGLGRVGLFLVSAFWTPVFGFVTYATWIAPASQSVEGWLVTTLVGKLALAGMLFFAAGTVWSLFAPRWLEAFIVRSTGSFVLWLAAFALFCLPYALWACFCA